MEIPRLYHGTPLDIHTFDSPVLDPRFTKSHHTGDPYERRIFATSNLLLASIFGLDLKRESGCRSIFFTDSGPVAVLDGLHFVTRGGGNVYEVSHPNFQPLVLNDRPPELWFIAENDMPWCGGSDDEYIRGIPVSAPYRRVSQLGLIEQEGLRVYMMTGNALTADYFAESRQAYRDKREGEFLDDLVKRQWLINITSRLLEPDFSIKL